MEEQLAINGGATSDEGWKGEEQPVVNNHRRCCELCARRRGAGEIRPAARAIRTSDNGQRSVASARAMSNGEKQDDWEHCHLMLRRRVSGSR
ncbi:hypothetical protein U1Q18_046249 [Sarracenia purpurea var. burkii]